MASSLRSPWPSWRSGPLAHPMRPSRPTGRYGKAFPSLSMAQGGIARVLPRYDVIQLQLPIKMQPMQLNAVDFSCWSRFGKRVVPEKSETESASSTVGNSSASKALPEHVSYPAANASLDPHAFTCTEQSAAAASKQEHPREEMAVPGDPLATNAHPAKNTSLPQPVPTAEAISIDDTRLVQPSCSAPHFRPTTIGTKTFSGGTSDQDVRPISYPDASSFTFLHKSLSSSHAHSPITYYSAEPRRSASPLSIKSHESGSGALHGYTTTGNADKGGTSAGRMVRLGHMEHLYSLLQNASETALRLHLTKQWRRLLLVLASFGTVIGVGFFFFWDTIKRVAGQEGADLLSNQLLANETLHFTASEFSKQLIDDIFNDSRLQQVVARWAQDILNSSERELADLVVRTLNTKIVKEKVLQISDDIVKPTAREAAADWCIHLIHRPDISSALQVLVILNESVLQDSSVRQQAVQTASFALISLLNDPSIAAVSQDYVSKVLLEPSFQAMLSEALWSVFKKTVAPKW
ncbi:hypothetical protein IE077_004461 [Cardiosporidium cionae]|uniref:CLASP N-terminal domain-containing protein n=1 Tax=Cardiosporidium cionae TaxID=476202 RepID=A0ABQ7J9A4_9APIC|nr:hypothetical protein IE077_004461 [Cardiosporidium cionae]|eukprot:KAF8820583.1 hypothetical protein IE077_004461 [Cardiosporidium cionae]